MDWAILPHKFCFGNKIYMDKIKAKKNPKKSLGQNFLTDESVLLDIVEAIRPAPGETIVEIGPGHGALTLPLLESGAKIIGIEKDEQLAGELKINYPKIKIIEGDALDVIRNYKLGIVNSNEWKLVGNIPYYITGHLFRMIGEIDNKPSLIVFMIQKEVAERICARVGEMNLLAASIQIWAKPEIVRFVSRKAFNPQPKVDSAVIRLVPQKIRNSELEIKNYYSLLRIIFKQPRKTIFNNLRDGGFPADKIELALKKINMDFKARPQDLSIENLKNLSSIITLNSRS